jgi:hypothetical protein
VETGSKLNKDTILELVEETPDIAIEELRQALAEKSATIGYGTIRRSPRDHAQKKDGACGRAGSARHCEAARGLVRRSTRS